MLVNIPDVLNPTEIDAVRSVLHQCEYVDGKLSAGINAQKYKSNEEAAASDEQFEALNNVVMSRLARRSGILTTVTLTWYACGQTFSWRSELTLRAFFRVCHIP